MKQAKVVTAKELKKVLDYVDAFDRHAERNRAMLLLTHLCGMRVSEVASLKVNDVTSDNNVVNDIIFLSAEQTKGSDSRRVFVNTKAKSAIKRYLQSNTSVNNSVYLFTTQKSKHFDANTLQQLLKRLYERCSIVGATSHSGRRTFITKLATAGVSVYVIAELASHKSIQTTQRYISVNDNLMTNAIELA
jgi:integrase/recombinase XerD